MPKLIWITFAALSIVCACVRYFGLSAIAYTLCYGLLTVSGLIAALWLVLQGRGYRAGKGGLFMPAFAPLILLFVDLSSHARIVCLIAIALATLSAPKRQGTLTLNVL